VSSDPLHIRFGDVAARIYCEDLGLRRSLRHHFHHCQGETASAVLTYRITTDEASVTHLRHDGDEYLYRGRHSPYLIQHLIHELTKALAGRCRDHLVFHAAGLACGENGLILFGGSGSGKSTLAAWLTAGGLGFLTDEVVAVPYGVREMVGLPRPIGLKAGSDFVWRQLLDANARARITRFPDGSVLLDPEHLRRGCVRASASPNILLFSRYAPGEPFGVRSLSPALALFSLLKHAINPQHLPGQGFRAATRLARQTAAYSLTYSDMATVAAWIEQVAGPPCRSRRSIDRG
jgi:hypothetical protein